MLKDLAKRAGLGAASAVMASTAAAIALVALAFCLYALLKLVVAPAGAAGITALVFAALAGLFAFTAPKLTKAAKPTREEVAAVRPRVDPETLRLAAEAGVAVLGAAADMALSRRLKREEKVRKSRRRR
ncbi:MAG: hypothetical protein JOZ27_05895 [Caulobacteraceae bacterium]|nr:hypothetical protein [Caulobacteraceae bacterium]